jgi:serine/threonine protein kinase
MSDISSIDQLKFWIRYNGFPDFELEDEFTRGTYGLVFFLNAKHRQPSTLALKTLDPETLPENTKSLLELQREFAKWLRLPAHNNVLGARQCKFAILSIPDSRNPDGYRSVKIPVMPMERMDGSLKHWTNSGRFTTAAKLSALAQAFNGLSHLYREGFEGHGDLKPDNILYTDISATGSAPPNTWLSELPWVVKIADFGWADAWLDYGYTNKALRAYMAPERLGAEAMFVCEKSDMFAMGIIVAEVLQGKHPALNLKRACESDGEWSKRAVRGDWNFEGITSDRLRNLVKGCLDPDPSKRPTAIEGMKLICDEMKEVHGIDIEPTLVFWSKPSLQDTLPFISNTSQEIVRLLKTIGLGNLETSKSANRLREIFGTLAPVNLYSLEDWVQAANGLLEFLNNDESNIANAERSQIREQARVLLESSLGSVSHSELGKMAASIYREDLVTPFEHFSHLVGDLASIAEVEFEQAYKGEWGLSDLALAGFAYHMHALSFLGSPRKRGIIDYLNISVDLSLTEAVPYYFRALRTHDLVMLGKVGLSENSGAKLKDVIRDLEMAIHLAPEWGEPKRRLEAIRRNA